MAIKLLILQACLIAAASEGEQAAHADIGETVEANSKEEALYLCRVGRTMYLDKSDDPTKGTLTATKEDKERVDKMAKQAKAAADAAVKAGQPLDMAAVIADAVTQGVKAALAAAAAASAATAAKV